MRKKGDWYAELSLSAVAPVRHLPDETANKAVELLRVWPREGSQPDQCLRASLMREVASALSSCSRNSTNERSRVART